jgi:hypothetical protein
MGAEVPVWVEVEKVERVWVKSHGVTKDEAAVRVSAETGQRLTGRTSYERPVYPERVDDTAL